MVKQETSFTGCVGSQAFRFRTKKSSQTPCFTPVTAVPPQTGSGGHCLEKSLPPQLCGHILKMNVSIQCDFSTALWCCTTKCIGLKLIHTDQLAAGPYPDLTDPATTSMWPHEKSGSGFTSVFLLMAQIPEIDCFQHNTPVQSGCNLSTGQWKQFDKNHLKVVGAHGSEMAGSLLAWFCSCHIF